MTRFLSVVIVGCMSFVSACSNKGEIQTASPTDARFQQTPTVDSLETVQAKAEAGDVDAQFELGAMYHEGQSIEQDLTKARAWFTKAAAQNDARAQFNLGVMYYAGEGVPQSDAEAKIWFTKAAAQGNPRAQFNLGVMQYRGESMKQDFAGAMDSFKKAANYGSPEAAFNLGVMFVKGEGTDTDIAQAYMWLEAARSFGHPKAAETLQQIEAGLQPADLKAVKAMAEELKKTINANIAAVVESGTKF